jgi:predicted dehydrogenase
MSEEKLRVGIIGSGWIANVAHAQAWKSLSNTVDIVANADANAETAATFADANEIANHYDDYHAMLAKEDLDIVSVCTPNCYHREATLAALQAGAHVLCEKPIATSRPDAVEMYATAERAGCLLMVGQSSRFAPYAFAARDIVASGQLGEVYFAETTMLRRSGIPTWGQFHMMEGSAGGPVYDLGVHILDLLIWIMGNPRVVAVSGSTYTKFGDRDQGKNATPNGALTPRPYDYREFDVEDFAGGFLRLENGGSIALKTSWASYIPEKNQSGHLLLGTEGGMTFSPLTVTSRMGGHIVKAEPELPPGRKVPFSGHFGETENFVAAIRGREELLVKREEVLNVMGALDALYASAAAGREVTVRCD